MNDLADLQDAVRAVRIFGYSAAQAAQGLEALGKAAKKLEADIEMLKRAAASKRPWHRRRWR